MSAEAKLSKASYFKENSATSCRQGARTAQFSLFPIGSTSLYSAPNAKTCNLLLVQRPLLLVLLLNPGYIAALLLFFIFMLCFPRSWVPLGRGHILYSVISCRVIFVLVNLQEIVFEWMNEWKNDKNWTAVVGELLGNLVKRIRKLRSS